MGELEYDARVRLWLQERYFPWGIWENNKTGYRGHHHRQLGGKGGTDLVGSLAVLRVDIEVKAWRTRQSDEQKVRQNRYSKPWSALYAICRESCVVVSHPKHAEPVDSGFLKCCDTIDEFARSWLPASLLRTMGVDPK